MGLFRYVLPLSQGENKRLDFSITLSWRLLSFFCLVDGSTHSSSNRADQYQDFLLKVMKAYLTSEYSLVFLHCLPQCNQCRDVCVGLSILETTDVVSTSGSEIISQPHCVIFRTNVMRVKKAWFLAAAHICCFFLMHEIVYYRPQLWVTWEQVVSCYMPILIYSFHCVNHPCTMLNNPFSHNKFHIVQVQFITCGVYMLNHRAKLINNALTYCMYV